MTRTQSTVDAACRRSPRRVAVSLMLSLSFKPIDHVLHPGGATLAALIALKFGNASTPFYRQALIAAGLALFALVLIVNMIARLIVVRSSPERRAR